MSAATPRKRSVDHNEDFPTFDDPADMVNAVISALQQPDDKTNVSATYSNEKNIASEVQAYAKIAGQSWTFYVKSLAVSIGRNTDNQSASQIAIDIDLGPAKVVSRSHAAIAYNLDLRCWELKVFGRNGARVDGQKVPVGESSATSLHSGAILDIGGTQMMFILPDSPPDIPRKILHQCLARYQNKSRKSSQSSFPQAHPMSVNNGSQIKSFQMFDKAQLSHSPSSVSATSLQNNLDQDLSKEEAKDIKPPYSYATMITQAILSNQEGVMSLSEIYNWIASHYAYYKFSKTGWQNSIRHNLSLNKAFEKVPRRPNEPGKGMKWRISESYKEEFMNKIQSGSLSKSRRGSSVSRQLQLHLATYQQLPESQREFPKEGVNQFDHQRTDSLSKFGSMPYQGMPSNMSPPIAYMPQQPVNGFINPSRSYGYQHPAHPPHMMYGNSMVPGSVNQSMAHGLNLGKPELASPIRQYGDVSGTTPRLPKVGGNNLFGFPPPASSSNNPIGPASSNQHPHPNTFNDNQNYSSGNNTHTSESNNSNSTAPSTNSDALGFTSPKKILPLEAFTPERGSKPQDASKLNIPSRMSTSQSSPAFWNFVQFSTPNGQTPGRDNNEDVNGHGSPTLNRKYQNSKEDSPLRHRRDEKAIDLKEKSDLEKEDTKNKKSEIAS